MTRTKKVDSHARIPCQTILCTSTAPRSVVENHLLPSNHFQGWALAGALCCTLALTAFPARAYGLPFSGQGSGDNETVTQVVKQVQPAVMGVVNYGRVSDLWSDNVRIQPAGVGTGVLFQKNAQYGFVATNNHVVEGAVKVEVVLASGRHVPAFVVGTDPYTDLAVLRIPSNIVAGDAPVRFADSRQVQVGEPAIAIGTPLGLDFAESVTAGIVSAKKRIMPVEEAQTQRTLDFQAVIQTDAAINPGNSGGPLLNIRGEVMGINSSKIVAPNFEGMGFAIPSNEVKSIAEQILSHGFALHPALGVSGDSLAAVPEAFWPDVPVNYGVWVRKVTSPEAKVAGVQPEDVIIGIDQETVRDMADLRTYLFEQKPGHVVTLKVYRNNRPLTFKVKLGEIQSINTARAGASEGSTVPELPFPNVDPPWS
ncbi:PDZ domain-containing protein [Alicyclobacillaceae bacterium I2511]|nr:PDZ domain-containing protein [Alicyclobacillaceae bacterium I2511]